MNGLKHASEQNPSSNRENAQNLLYTYKNLLNRPKFTFLYISVLLKYKKTVTPNIVSIFLSLMFNKRNMLTIFGVIVLLDFIRILSYSCNFSPFYANILFANTLVFISLASPFILTLMMIVWTDSLANFPLLLIIIFKLIEFWNKSDILGCSPRYSKSKYSAGRKAYSKNRRLRTGQEN